MIDFTIKQKKKIFEVAYRIWNLCAIDPVKTWGKPGDCWTKIWKNYTKFQTDIFHKDPKTSLYTMPILSPSQVLLGFAREDRTVCLSISIIDEQRGIYGLGKFMDYWGLVFLLNENPAFFKGVRGKNRLIWVRWIE